MSFENRRPGPAPPRSLPATFARVEPLAVWPGERGTLWYFEPAPHTIYSIGEGYVSTVQARALRERGDAVFGRSKKVWAVHDWADLTGYESAARNTLTEWSIARRTQLEGCVILTGSKLVAMGVSAASIPLTFAGIALEAHTDRVEFESRAVAVLRRSE